MNKSILLRLLSVIIAALAGAFLLSLLVELGNAWRQEVEPHAGTLRGFLLSAGICLSLSGGLYAMSRGGSNRLFAKEALAVIGVGWLTASVVGALPYVFILGLGPAEAFFESASGLTTTGASVLSELEGLSAGLLFWRSISQWIGGLGVVVFFVAVLAFIGAGSKILFSRESSAHSTDLAAGRAQTGVLQIVRLYLGLSILCAVTYRVCGLTWFDAVNHMFTTISTGGFSTRSGSAADFANPAFEWCVVLFMALGGTSFPLLLSLLRRDLGELRESTELRAYLGILVVAVAAVFALLLVQQGLGAYHEKARASAFQVVAIMTTTGYATADFARWLPGAQVILLILMIVGGCAGSTGGGVKVARVAIAWKIVRAHIEKAYRPRVVRPIRFDGEEIDADERESILVFFTLAILATCTGILALALLEPQMSLTGALSAVFASVFNIGPGLAEVGPTQTFAFFQPASKVLLSLLMIFGRLEFYALAVLFSPAFWKRY